MTFLVIKSILLITEHALLLGKVTSYMMSCRKTVISLSFLLFQLYQVNHKAILAGLFLVSSFCYLFFKHPNWETKTSKLNDDPVK